MSDNRSLSSGMSLPQWMKTRMNDKLKFDQSTFSPPENDDNFLYIRYNRTSSTANTSTNSSDPSTSKIEVVASSTITSNQQSGTDFSKHTGPCQQFIATSIHNASEVVRPISGKVKPSGTDDGFKGEAAQCGSSVIRVAHQMVSSKLFRDSKVLEEEFATEPAGFNRSLRRGSKSLPTTPLSSPHSSPKSRRRQVNRYFGSTTDPDKIQGSWILPGLLRKHDKLSQSVNIINEEDGMYDTVTKSVSQISIDDVADVTKTPKKTLKPKPSELREMNFWSPTSM